MSELGERVIRHRDPVRLHLLACPLHICRGRGHCRIARHAIAGWTLNKRQATADIISRARPGELLHPLPVGLGESDSLQCVVGLEVYHKACYLDETKDPLS